MAATSERRAVTPTLAAISQRLARESLRSAASRISVEWLGTGHPAAIEARERPGTLDLEGEGEEGTHRVCVASVRNR